MGDGVSWAVVIRDREARARKGMSMAEISAEKEERDGRGRKSGRR